MSLKFFQMCSGASEFGPKIDELLKSITLFSTERHALELRNEWNTYLQNGYLLVFCLDIICMLWKGYTVCREHSALELNKKNTFRSILGILPGNERKVHWSQWNDKSFFISAYTIGNIKIVWNISFYKSNLVMGFIYLCLYHR